MFVAPQIKIKLEWVRNSNSIKSIGMFVAPRFVLGLGIKKLLLFNQWENGCGDSR
jgi:hypothetical protein